MLTDRKTNKQETRNAFVRPATVTGGPDQGRYPLSVALDGEWKLGMGRPATAEARHLKTGDQVLVTGEDVDDCYITGVLQDAEAAHDEIKSATGATASRSDDEGEEFLRIADGEGRVLFEYRPERGVGILSMPDGDLVLQAAQGSIHMLSADSIVCSSTGPLVAESAQGMSLRVQSDDGEASSLTLGDGQCAIASEHLDIQAGAATAEIERAAYSGKYLTGSVDRAKWVYGKLESLADRMIERVRNVYRYTEELHQTKAGRMRTLVKGDSCHHSERMDLRAGKQVKIDGERINIG